MSRVASEKSACSRSISERLKPIWSFQKRVMMAIGRRAIFRLAKMLRRRMFLLKDCGAWRVACGEGKSIFRS